MGDSQENFNQYELVILDEPMNNHEELKEEYAEYCHPLDPEQLLDRGVQTTADELVANGAQRGDVIKFVKTLFGEEVSRKTILSAIQNARDPNRNYYLERRDRLFQPFELESLRERGLQFTIDQLIANGSDDHNVKQIASALFGEEISEKRIYEAIELARDKTKNVLYFDFQ